MRRQTAEMREENPSESGLYELKLNQNLQWQMKKFTKTDWQLQNTPTHLPSWWRLTRKCSGRPETMRPLYNLWSHVIFEQFTPQPYPPDTTMSMWINNYGIICVLAFLVDVFIFGNSSVQAYSSFKLRWWGRSFTGDNVISIFRWWREQGSSIS